MPALRSLDGYTFSHMMVRDYGTTVPPRQESSWEQDVKTIQNTRGATTRQVSTEKDPGIVTDHKMNMNH